MAKCTSKANGTEIGWDAFQNMLPDTLEQMSGLTENKAALPFDFILTVKGCLY